MSKTPLVKTIFLPPRRARSTNARASLLVTELDPTLKRPRVVGAIDANIANLRFHSKGVEQTMVVVRVTVGLVRRQVEPVGAFDKIQFVDPERHHGTTIDLGGLEFFEVGIRAIDANVVGVEQAKAENEVGDLFSGRHFHADLDRVAALKDVTGFMARTRERDIGDLDLARAPTTFI